jgi:hypothetical protein
MTSRESKHPTNTLDWYIKWFSSIVAIVAIICRSIEEVPKIYDVMLTTIACAGLLIVSVMWRDRALMVLNIVGLFVLIMGLIRYFFYLT